MSRIGNRVLTIPNGVSVEVTDLLVTVKGPKGTLTHDLPKKIKVTVEDNTVKVERLDEIKTTKQLHGTTNAIIKNMIDGVSAGYSKGLEIIGVGYRFNVSGKKLVINAGYSHTVDMEVPEELSVEAISNTEIKVSGIDKVKVGKFAAEVRDVRRPEPYKGKGIRYVGEHVRRKEGKKASK